MSEPVLRVDGLKVAFPTPGGRREVVRGISFGIEEGTAYGIVGESGCGKSMTAYAIMGLVPRPGSIDGGRIVYRGTDLVAGGSAA